MYKILVSLKPELLIRAALTDDRINKFDPGVTGALIDQSVNLLLQNLTRPVSIFYRIEDNTGVFAGVFAIHIENNSVASVPFRVLRPSLFRDHPVINTQIDGYVSNQLWRNDNL